MGEPHGTLSPYASSPTLPGMGDNSEEREWKTRKKRIDPRLDALGWKWGKAGTSSVLPFRTEEEETDNGPADYALWLNSRQLVGVVEAKKVTVGPQNVLTQAERYARGVRGSKFNFEGLRVPFLYSTNGEVFWFHDVRHPLNLSRRVANLHTILNEVRVPLPPFAEQRRIVSSVDALLAQVNAARERLEKVPRLLKRFRQAVLAKAVRGELVPTEAELAAREGRSFQPAAELLGRSADAVSDEMREGWARIAVRSVFQCWGGMTPSTSNSAYWEHGTVPWRSSKDIKAGRITGATEKVTSAALQATRLRLCRAGTVVVVVRSGVLAHTLPVATLGIEAVVNQDLKALDSGDDSLNEWLALYLRVHEQQILASNRKEGTTVQSIRVEELLDLEMPVPPAQSSAASLPRSRPCWRQPRRSRLRRSGRRGDWSAHPRPSSRRRSPANSCPSRRSWRASRAGPSSPHPSCWLGLARRRPGPGEPQRSGAEEAAARMARPLRSAESPALRELVDGMRERAAYPMLASQGGATFRLEP